MDSIATIGDGEQLFGRYEYDDRTVVAVDFGVSDDALEADVVGDTAIVVVEDDGNVSQAEFELPNSSATVETNNGVLTVVIEE